MIDFKSRQSNQLLINPKLSENEKSVLQELQAAFENEMGTENFFLIASSGSSQKSTESAKLIAISVEHVLNSARRFNMYFKANAQDHWGLVLPEFHVAGLSVYARAHLSGARVNRSDWSATGFSDWIVLNGIRFISLVPTQIYDLVQLNVQAPAGIKKIFVGSGALNENLRQQIKKLGWPLVETYGMTETCSMIAVKENSQNFKILPGVEVKIENQRLKIYCDSLLKSQLQKKEDQILIKNYSDKDWYLTEDLVEVDSENFLHLLGRATDYIKILGEGVSMSELRERLQTFNDTDKIELVAVPDERAGYALILVVENSAPDGLGESLMQSYNLKARPYERITRLFKVQQIPRTELGKLKVEELKSIICS